MALFTRYYNERFVYWFNKHSFPGWLPWKEYNRKWQFLFIKFHSSNWTIIIRHSSDCLAKFMLNELKVFFASKLAYTATGQISYLTSLSTVLRVETFSFLLKLQYMLSLESAVIVPAYLYCRIIITQWTFCTAGHHSLSYMYCRTLLSELSVLQSESVSSCKKCSFIIP